MSFYSVTLLYENNTITKERVQQKADLMLEETERIVRERMITAESTVQELLGISDSKRYNFRKEYLIYADYYTYQNGKKIGAICILFDLDAMKKMWNRRCCRNAA